LQERDAIEEVEKMEFEDNEDDYNLARSKVDPSEVKHNFYLNILSIV
jgi:glyoxylate utilization-related uncharacterized protein